MFHQMEGLMVDENVTLADLKTVLKLFASNYLGDDVPIRIRPSFFPFTEPSVEADYFWNGKWVEFGGAGVVGIPMYSKRLVTTPNGIPDLPLVWGSNVFAWYATKSLIFVRCLPMKFASCVSSISGPSNKNIFAQLE